MGIESRYKLLEKIGSLKYENEKLIQTIAEIRFASFLVKLASLTHRSPGVIKKSLENLDLTETFMQVCKNDTAGWHWQEDCTLYFLSPFADIGNYKLMDDVDKFYEVLQILNEQNAK